MTDERPIGNQPEDEQDVEAHKAFQSEPPVGDKAATEDDDDVEAHAAGAPPVGGPIGEPPVG